MIFKNANINTGLHIIIVGCGKVGTTLVEQLSKEGHDITVIDTDFSKIQEIANMYDVMGITGNGASYSIQMDAGIETADMIIAVTPSDELNLLCCTIAKQVGDDCAAIARVRTPDYSKEVAYLREKLGLTMVINPELETAKEIARILALPTVLDVNIFSHNQAELIKIKIPDNNILDGIKIMDLGSVIDKSNNNLSRDILICGVERNEEVTIPRGTFELKAGDIITIVASPKDIRNLLSILGLLNKKVKDTMIVGGGSSTYYLANQLIASNINVKIIELDEKRCERLSILLPKATIINGDGSDLDLLKEEGLEDVDSFVPLTGVDEENIMLTLHARTCSNAKAITKISRSNYKTVINNLDLGSVIYPRYITSEAIIAYVRAKNNSSRGSNIETLFHLFDNKAEAIEFHVDKESQITNTPLMNISLKDNVLVACIFRNGHVIIPSGSDEIHVGDMVVIVTKNEGYTDLLDILN